MEDVVRLEAGKLVVFTRNGRWQTRIALSDGRYPWRSLKAANATDAQRAGSRLLSPTEFKLAKGMPVHARSPGAVIDEHVAHRQRDMATSTIGPDTVGASKTRQPF